MNIGTSGRTVSAAVSLAVIAGAVLFDFGGRPASYSAGAGKVFAGEVREQPVRPEAKKGSKGVIVGVITKMDGGKVTVKGETEELLLFPFWRGGLPKDGGGFDKQTLKRLEDFRVGDRVRASWVVPDEHYRIKNIEHVK